MQKARREEKGKTMRTLVRLVATGVDLLRLLDLCTWCNLSSSDTTRKRHARCT